MYSPVKIIRTIRERNQELRERREEQCSLFWSERKIFSWRNHRLLFDVKAAEEDRRLVRLVRLARLLMPWIVLRLVAWTEQICWADIFLSAAQLIGGRIGHHVGGRRGGTARVEHRVSWSWLPGRVAVVLVRLVRLGLVVLLGKHGLALHYRRLHITGAASLNTFL